MKTLKFGSVIHLADSKGQGENYILARVGPTNEACFVNLTDGNRWENPISIKEFSIHGVSKKDFEILVDKCGNKEHLIKTLFGETIEEKIERFKRTIYFINESKCETSNRFYVTIKYDDGSVATHDGMNLISIYENLFKSRVVLTIFE